MADLDVSRSYRAPIAAGFCLLLIGLLAIFVLGGGSDTPADETADPASGSTTTDPAGDAIDLGGTVPALAIDGAADVVLANETSSTTSDSTSSTATSISDEAPTTSTSANTSTTARRTTTTACVPQRAWRLKEEDTFAGTQLSTGKWVKWTDTQWWGDFVPGAVTVANGHLAIAAQREDGKVSSGGVGSIFGQRYGAWEIRMRMTNETGSSLFPIVQILDRHDHKNSANVHLYRVEPGTRSINTRIAMPRVNIRRFDHPSTIKATQWHTFRVEWTEKEIAIYRDGVRVKTYPASPHVDVVDHEIAIQVTSTAQEPGNATDTLLVDWVKIYEPTLTTCPIT